jgi:hypothetical protein
MINLYNVITVFMDVIPDGRLLSETLKDLGRAHVKSMTFCYIPFSGKVKMVLVSPRSLSCVLNEAVCRRPIGMGTRVRSQATSCEICGRKSGRVTYFRCNTLGFLLSIFFHQCIYICNSSSGGSWDFAVGLGQLLFD